MWDTRRSASVDKSEDVALRKGLDWIVLYSLVCLLPSRKRSFWWLAPFTCTGRWYIPSLQNSFVPVRNLHCLFPAQLPLWFSFVSDLSVKFVTCTESRCCLRIACFLRSCHCDFCQWFVSSIRNMHWVTMLPLCFVAACSPLPLAVSLDEMAMEQLWSQAPTTSITPMASHG